ncbi:hypothetical protein K6U51_12160 [Vibrio fluvialis]|uniref:hypothetical protein n=1 Tax=Vibrio fluvialis TaxID=676 RepID=UPI001EEB85D5|nr:hypothetical protein [Vibrio fluvialis]MCG6387542.1 hypothetical protein [Vibrio fluvialis]MCG6418789.1 hypothetical protein [Vibrio fluvialis]
MNDKNTNELQDVLTEDFLDSLDERFDVFVSGEGALPGMTLECIKHIATTRPDMISAGRYGEKEINHFLTNHFKL